MTEYELKTPKDFSETVNNAVKGKTHWVLLAGCPTGKSVIGAMLQAILIEQGLAQIIGITEARSPTIDSFRYGTVDFHHANYANRGPVHVILINKNLMDRSALQSMVQVILPGFEIPNKNIVIFADLPDGVVCRRCEAFLNWVENGTPIASPSPDTN